MELLGTALHVKDSWPVPVSSVLFRKGTIDFNGLMGNNSFCAHLSLSFPTRKRSPPFPHHVYFFAGPIVSVVVKTTLKRFLPDPLFAEAAVYFDPRL